MLVLIFSKPRDVPCRISTPKDRGYERSTMLDPTIGLAEAKFPENPSNCIVLLFELKLIDVLPFKLLAMVKMFVVGLTVAVYVRPAPESAVKVFPNINVNDEISILLIQNNLNVDLIVKFNIRI